MRLIRDKLIDKTAKEEKAGARISTIWRLVMNEEPRFTATEALLALFHPKTGDLLLVKRAYGDGDWSLPVDPELALTPKPSELIGIQRDLPGLALAVVPEKLVGYEVTTRGEDRVLRACFLARWHGSEILIALDPTVVAEICWVNGSEAALALVNDEAERRHIETVYAFIEVQTAIKAWSTHGNQPSKPRRVTVLLALFHDFSERLLLVKVNGRWGLPVSAELSSPIDAPVHFPYVPWCVVLQRVYVADLRVSVEPSRHVHTEAIQDGEVLFERASFLTRWFGSDLIEVGMAYEDVYWSATLEAALERVTDEAERRHIEAIYACRRGLSDEDLALLI